MTAFFFGILLIGWFLIVYTFSSQTGRESSKVSDKVTRELLKIKDTICVVIENYQDTGEIVIKRNSNQSNHQCQSRQMGNVGSKICALWAICHWWSDYLWYASSFSGKAPNFNRHIFGAITRLYRRNSSIFFSKSWPKVI